MRITGGELGGLVLKAPKGSKVRPTQDRVREAVFSMLAAKVAGAGTLDLFAGTGALGIEAASRGAARVTWVEEDRRNVEVIRENVRLLASRGCETEVVCDEAGRFLRRRENMAYDLVFADPPYEWVARGGWEKIMPSLSAALAEDGVFVAEQGADQPARAGEGLELLRDRVYGGTRVCVYRKEKKHEP